MAVSRSEVRRIAALARLSFSEEEEEQMAKELSRILDHVDTLNEVDTSGVSPMSHVLDITDVDREDEVEARISRDDALQNAPDHDGESFRVPKVIEE